MDDELEKNEFAQWLEGRGMTRAEYARSVGLHPNTIHRRARGELATPKETMTLLRALDGEPVFGERTKK